MKKWLALLLCTIAILVQAAGNTDTPDLNKLLQNDQLQLWKLNSEDFTRQFKVDKILSYSNSDLSRFRYYFKNRQHYTMSFCGLKIYEAVFSFKQDNLCRMYISLYNCGDAGGMDRYWFETLRNGVEQKLEELAGGKADNAPVYPVGPDKIYEKNFYCRNYNLKLQWSSSITAKKDFKAAYIQLIILPPPVRNESIPADKSLTAADLKARVQRNPDGDCFVDVPMVDQGKKGYCTHANDERMAQYFGSTLNQHVFAQVFHEIAGNRAQIKAAEETIGLPKTSLYANSDFSTETNAAKLISMYNQEAVKAREPTIPPGQFIQKSKGKAKFDYKAILHAMNPDIYLKAKSDDIAGITKFKNDIITNINRGLPIIWRVRTGVFERREHIGKHRMMIVGYNPRENVMIYSDSRGTGQHRKVSWEKAWAISNGLVLCLPKSIAASIQDSTDKVENDNNDDNNDDDNND